MDNKLPRVSVGLAVYNGEEYLEEAIESIRELASGTPEVEIFAEFLQNRSRSIVR